jgi:hypothetical protein
MRYWVNTISREHVQRGVDGGFTQAGHGKAAGLKRMAKGDRIVFYSPRTELDGGEPLQAFTAIGTIADDAPIQVEMTPDFQPWRRKVVFATSEEAPIRPLIESLDFIRNKKSWGFVFRRGLFAIEERDFQTIERAMTAFLGTGTSPAGSTS